MKNTPGRCCRPGGKNIEHGTVKSTLEAMEEWAQELAKRFSGKPITVAAEQQRCSVVALLSKYAHLVAVSNSSCHLGQLSQELYTSGAMSDPSDVLLQL